MRDVRQACGCDEHHRAGFSRRSFLRRTAAIGAATALTGRGLATQVAFAATPDYVGDVLVVLSLRGGFDGLNVVVPAGDPGYYAARPTIGVPQSRLVALDATFGLHPSMARLKPYWDAGTFAAVHAVGQVNPTRSHFEATEEMERAAPGSSLRTGWIDRVLGTHGAGTAFQGCQVGDPRVASAFAGPSAELGMYRIDDFDLSGAGDELPAWDAALRALNADAPPAVAGPVATTLGAVATTRALRDAGYTPDNGAAYDADSDLAMALRDVARLVKAGVGLQVAAVDYGDWDMHAGLVGGDGNPGAGWLHDKLTELSGALDAFLTDLGPALSGVTLVTLSEFGRRVGENGSLGVDHGHGNAVLLFGGGVVGGRVHGAWPGLAEAALDDGDLAARTDYRDVLGEVLVKRCAAGSLGSVFPGLAPAPLGVVRAR